MLSPELASPVGGELVLAGAVEHAGGQRLDDAGGRRPRTGPARSCPSTRTWGTVPAFRCRSDPRTSSQVRRSSSNWVIWPTSARRRPELQPKSASSRPAPGRPAATASRPGPPLVGGSGHEALAEQGGHARRRRRRPGRRGRSRPRGRRAGGPAGASAEQRGGEVGVVAGGQAEVGERIGPVGVEAGRDEQPGRVEGRREGRHHLVDPGAVGVAGGARGQREVDRRAPARRPRRPRAARRCPGRAGTGGTRRRRRARRSRRCPGCRCRGGRRSRRSAPARPAPASAAAVTATLLNRQKPIDRVGVAWWPGRPHRAERAVGLARRRGASTASSPAPAAEQRGVVGRVVHRRVGVDPAAALRADPWRSARPGPASCTRSSSAARGRSGHDPLDAVAEAGRLDARRGPLGAGRVAPGDRGRGRGRGTARGSAGGRSRPRHDRRRHYRGPHDRASPPVGR